MLRLCVQKTKSHYGCSSHPPRATTPGERAWDLCGVALVAADEQALAGSERQQRIKLVIDRVEKAVTKYPSLGISTDRSTTTITDGLSDADSTAWCRTELADR